MKRKSKGNQWKWCPNGCGKKVKYHAIFWKIRKENYKGYKCEKCYGEFTKKDIDDVMNKSKSDENDISKIP